MNNVVVEIFDALCRVNLSILVANNFYAFYALTFQDA